MAEYLDKTGLQALWAKTKEQAEGDVTSLCTVALGANPADIVITMPWGYPSAGYIDPASICITAVSHSQAGSLYIRGYVSDAPHLYSNGTGIFSMSDISSAEINDGTGDSQITIDMGNDMTGTFGSIEWKITLRRGLYGPYLSV